MNDTAAQTTIANLGKFVVQCQPRPPPVGYRGVGCRIESGMRIVVARGRMV